MSIRAKVTYSNGVNCSFSLDKKEYYKEVYASDGVDFERKTRQLLNTHSDVVFRPKDRYYPDFVYAYAKWVCFVECKFIRVKKSLENISDKQLCHLIEGVMYKLHNTQRKQTDNIIHLSEHARMSYRFCFNGIDGSIVVGAEVIREEDE